MSGPISSCPPRKRTAERKPLSCFPGSCSGWCLSDTAKHERKMWNSAAIGLIAVWRLWVCKSASTSQKFSFNLTQVIGPMKLNWVKKENQKRSVNHFFSQPLNNGSRNPDFCTRNHSDEEDIDDIFVLNTEDAICFLRKGSEWDVPNRSTLISHSYVARSSH